MRDEADGGSVIGFETANGRAKSSGSADAKAVVVGGTSVSGSEGEAEAGFGPGPGREWQSWAWAGTHLEAGTICSTRPRMMGSGGTRLAVSSR